MILKSFRCRLAFLSAIVSGFILILFGTMTWFLLYRELENTVDCRILAIGKPLALHAHAHMRWDVFSEMAKVFTEEAILSVVDNADGAVLYQSDAWPETLRTDRSKRTNERSHVFPTDTKIDEGPSTSMVSSSAVPNNRSRVDATVNQKPLRTLHLVQNNKRPIRGNSTNCSNSARSYPVC